MNVGQTRIQPRLLMELTMAAAEVAEMIGHPIKIIFVRRNLGTRIGSWVNLLLAIPLHLRNIRRKKCRKVVC